mmetsp:Transcript_20708/g.45083  ORF Transcript_20708/g.45083 Transcript_20708/m.45083 type:complete len:204 (+) Transcript_20708:75-686(+)
MDGFRFITSTMFLRRLWRLYVGIKGYCQIISQNMGRIHSNHVFTTLLGRCERRHTVFDPLVFQCLQLEGFRQHPIGTAMSEMVHILGHDVSGHTGNVGRASHLPHTLTGIGPIHYRHFVVEENAIVEISTLQRFLYHRYGIGTVVCPLCCMAIAFQQALAQLPIGDRVVHNQHAKMRDEKFVGFQYIFYVGCCFCVVRHFSGG